MTDAEAGSMRVKRTFIAAASNNSSNLPIANVKSWIYIFRCYYCAVQSRIYPTSALFTRIVRSSSVMGQRRYSIIANNTVMMLVNTPDPPTHTL